MTDEACPVLTREQLRNFIPEPLVIATQSVGTLHLRWLSARDMDFLSRLLREEMDDRAFLIRLIEHQIVATDGPVLPTSWSTEQLFEVFSEWAPHRSTLATVVPAGSGLDVARSLISAAIERWEAPLREMAARLKRDYVIPASVLSQMEGVARLQFTLSQIRSEFAANLAYTLAPIRQTAATVAALHVRPLPLPDLKGLFDALPDLGHLNRMFRELRDGKAVLDGAGYGFTADVWELSFLRELAQDQPSSVAVNRALLHHSRTPEFASSLEAAFSSTYLRRRWAPIAAGHRAHVHREYLLSIPALLPQLEGVVSDLLLLRRQATKHGRKFVAREPNGRAKLNKKGKPVELTGLRAKIDRTDYASDDDLKEAAEFIVDTMVRQRNDILHGTRTRYGQAKLSVQVLLLLWVLGSVVADAQRTR